MDKSYLASIQEFTDRSPFGPDLAERLEQTRKGLLMRLAAAVSSEIDARLGKKYQRPIPNAPEIVKIWCADLLTPRAYEALGTRPTDEDQARINERAGKVYQDLKEAADNVNGLFDLPLSAANSASGMQAPTTQCYTEHSPYTSRHRQFDRVRGNRRYG